MAINKRLVSVYPGEVQTVGSTGEAVRQIQQCVNNISNRFPEIPKLAEDGIFGNGTRGAVIIFQRLFQLTADGIVGAATWNRLMQECSGSGGGSSSAYPGYPLTVGTSGNAVRQVQHCLNNIGRYWPGISLPVLAEDGMFGPGTESAVLAFQQFFVLPANGAVGPETWDRIITECQAIGEIGGGDGNVSNNPEYPGYIISAGSSGSYVRMIQECLNNVGSINPSIPRLTEDGVFGSGTRGAVVIFQQMFGLNPDGIVGKMTWDKLMLECAGTRSVPASIIWEIISPSDCAEEDETPPPKPEVTPAPGCCADKEETPPPPKPEVTPAPGCCAEKEETPPVKPEVTPAPGCCTEKEEAPPPKPEVTTALGCCAEKDETPPPKPEVTPAPDYSDTVPMLPSVKKDTCCQRHSGCGQHHQTDHSAVDILWLLIIFYIFSSVRKPQAHCC